MAIVARASGRPGAIRLAGLAGCLALAACAVHPPGPAVDGTPDLAAPGTALQAGEWSSGVAAPQAGNRVEEVLAPLAETAEPGLLPVLQTSRPVAEPASGDADADETRFREWLMGVRADAVTAGLSPASVDAALAQARLLPRVIELDRKQPETTISYATYAERVLSADRIRQGREMLARHRTLLERIGAAYGVDPEVIVALWGIETNYGGFTGGFLVIPALATLAFDGRRSDYFRGELIHALRIVDEGHIAPDDMRGSWAGAMGQSQFMPSSFVNYAVDFDGDGAKDIWNTLADVFASAANYLASVGWQPGGGWGQEVRVPDGFDHRLAGLETEKPLAEWRRLGISRADGADLDASGGASLVLPDGEGGRAFLVFDNFRTTMRWNRSIYFATSVGLLSDHIAGRG